MEECEGLADVDGHVDCGEKHGSLFFFFLGGAVAGGGKKSGRAVCCGGWRDAGYQDFGGLTVLQAMADGRDRRRL